MRILTKIAEVFESWIDPLGPVEDLQPPDKIWPFFWHYLRQAKLPFVASLLAGGLTALLEALFFFYVGRLVDILDGGLVENGWAGLIEDHGGELAMMAFVVVIGRLIVSVISMLVDEQVINRGFYNLVRWQTYLYVARQSVSFFSNEFAGSVVSKVSQAGDALGDFLMGVMQVVWTIIIFTVTTLVLFARIDGRLAIIIVVWITVFLGLARFFLPRMRKNATYRAEAGAALNGRIVDSYANISTLKLFGRVEDNDRYVHQGFDRFLKTTRTMGRLAIGMRATLTLLSSLMIAAIGVVSIDLWSNDAISVGAVAFALSLVLRLNMWLGRLMGGLNGLMRNFGVVQNAMKTVSQPLSIVDAPDAITWQPEKGAIVFDNVTFNYASKKQVIENLDLNIAAGEKIGLVGRSGVGKTTIVNLLLRLYDVEDGRILIDGQDISAIKQDSLRGGIGVVTQDSALLHRSIRENIMFGRPNASEDEVIAAAKKAGAHDFIMQASDPAGRVGYNAHVGERGIKLSGGQRQRIAIARVLLKNAPILVLDEATSALDSEVEAAIQEQLQFLMQNKTVIAIAHRLSTLAVMDRLIVLDAGRIVEQGSHADLLDKDGHYARLWKRQSGGFIDSTPIVGSN